MEEGEGLGTTASVALLQVGVHNVRMRKLHWPRAKPEAKLYNNYQVHISAIKVSQYI